MNEILKHGQRNKYFFITAATLLPIVSLLLFVFVTSYHPVFTTMEKIVQKSLGEIEPLRNLQVALLNAGMPPNDYLIHGNDLEKQYWEESKSQVDAAFAIALKTHYAGPKKTTVVQLRKQWQESASMGDRLFEGAKTNCVPAEKGDAMERFDHSLFLISQQLEEVVGQLQQEAHEHHAQVEKLRYKGLIITISAIILGLLTGIGGSVWLTRARKKMVAISLYDTLTGILNRRALDVKLDQIHNDYQATASPGFSVLLLDIDHFKKVNDQYGHDAGDVVLNSFAQQTGKMIRSNDVFGRFGGEEFLVLLPETDMDKAALLAERIRKGIEETAIWIPGVEGRIEITVSIGCASSAGKGLSVHEIVQAADKAMYQAKNTGRNRVVCASMDA